MYASSRCMCGQNKYHQAWSAPTSAVASDSSTMFSLNKLSNFDIDVVDFLARLGEDFTKWFLVPR